MDRAVAEIDHTPRTDTAVNITSRSSNTFSHVVIVYFCFIVCISMSSMYSLVMCRLTFLICSVGFTSPMLFDERKQPYHLMLHKFFACGAQQTFFE